MTPNLSLNRTLPGYRQSRLASTLCVFTDRHLLKLAAPPVPASCRIVPQPVRTHVVIVRKQVTDGRESAACTFARLRVFFVAFIVPKSACFALLACWRIYRSHSSSRFSTKTPNPSIERTGNGRSSSSVVAWGATAWSRSVQASARTAQYNVRPKYIDRTHRKRSDSLSARRGSLPDVV